jgi:hypothetical protein
MEHEQLSSRFAHNWLFTHPVTLSLYHYTSQRRVSIYMPWKVLMFYVVGSEKPLIEII